MGKLYSLTIRFALLLITILGLNDSEALSVGREPSNTIPSITDVRVENPINLSSRFTTSRSFNYFTVDTVSILNVKVYPVPIADQLNISYHLDKDAAVSIHVYSILGNKLFTLMSQRMSAGDQKNTFSLASRLSSGIYLIYIEVGGKSPVRKRISKL